MVRGGERRRARAKPGTRSRIRCGDQRVLAHLRELARGQRAPACRGSGWRSRACRCRAAAPARRRSRSSAASAPSARADADRDHARAVGVAVGPRRLRVDDARRTRRRSRSRRVLVGRQRAGPRAPSAARSARRERVPERRVVAEASSASTSAGSNQRAAARAAPSRTRALDAARARGRSRRVCARQTMRAEQRDLLAAQAVRVAGAVPVLVERVDRLGGRLGQPEHARDLGAALAARLHQRARHLALVA